jgi:hypothetical protein
MKKVVLISVLLILLSGLGLFLGYHQIGIDDQFCITEPCLRLVIKSDSNKILVGDTIPVQFIITNIGKGPVKYDDRNYDRSGRMSEYALDATNSLGFQIQGPNHFGGIGGGLSGEGEIKASESFTKTIDLNQWAIIRKSGTYKIIGRYVWNYIKVFASDPIYLTIEDRSESEMSSYIDELKQQLAEIANTDRRNEISKKLAFSGSILALEPLIELTYEHADTSNTSFWAYQGLINYIPIDEQAKLRLFSIVEKKGLGENITDILPFYGMKKEKIVDLINSSLLSSEEVIQKEAAMAAQHYKDPKLVLPLLSFVKDSKTDWFARERAIYALQQYANQKEVVDTLTELSQSKEKINNADTAKEVLDRIAKTVER